MLPLRHAATIHPGNLLLPPEALLAEWSSGYNAGLATRWSRVRFPAAAASNGMGDRLRAGKPPQYFTEPPRPTQPSTLSGTGNE